MPATDRPRAGEQYRSIRRDAVDPGDDDHAAGLSRFTADLPEPPRTLHLALGFATIAAGRIVRPDMDAAAGSPGVALILSGADLLPAARQERVPLFAEADIVHHGQLLFVVIADSDIRARQAVRLAQFGTSPALPLIDIDDALRADSLLAPDVRIETGSLADAMMRAERRALGQLRIGGQAYPSLETITALAVPGEGGRSLRIAATVEDPDALRRLASLATGLPEAAIAIEVRRLAGLRGKGPAAVRIAAIAALAAARTGRPCRISLPRRDDQLVAAKRAETRVSYTVGFGEAGEIRAVDLSFTMRCGALDDGGVTDVERALLHADGGYFFPAARFVGRRMKTNTLPASTLRGAGAEGSLAAERILEHISRTVGRDPLDVRRANFYGQGRDRTPWGGTIEDSVLGQLVGELERTSEYRRRRVELDAFNQQSPILKRGLALVPTRIGIGSTDRVGNQAVALVEIAGDGTVRVGLGRPDEGQGIAIRAAQVVAEELGVRVDWVTVDAAGTAIPGPPAAGIDPHLLALVDACRILRDRLYDFIEEALGIERERVEFRPEGIRLGPVRSIAFAEVAAAAVTRTPLIAYGRHDVPGLGWDREQMTGRPFHYVLTGAACAEVTIDTTTGEKRIDRVDILQDVGRSLNPASDRGLIEGGFVFGLGWLTSEETGFDGAGRPLPRGLAGYAMPSAADIPADFRIDFFHSGGGREETAYRSRDVSDAAASLGMSVFFAISDAIASIRRGAQPRLSAPATPMAIMRAVRAMNEAEPAPRQTT